MLRRGSTRSIANTPARCDGTSGGVGTCSRPMTWWPTCSWSRGGDWRMCPTIRCRGCSGWRDGSSPTAAAVTRVITHFGTGSDLSSSAARAAGQADAPRPVRRCGPPRALSERDREALLLVAWEGCRRPGPRASSASARTHSRRGCIALGGVSRARCAPRPTTQVNDPGQRDTRCCDDRHGDRCDPPRGSMSGSDAGPADRDRAAPPTRPRTQIPRRLALRSGVLAGDRDRDAVWPGHGRGRGSRFRPARSRSSR